MSLLLFVLSRYILAVGVLVSVAPALNLLRP